MGVDDELLGCANIPGARCRMANPTPEPVCTNHGEVGPQNPMVMVMPYPPDQPTDAPARLGRPASSVAMSLWSVGVSS